VTRDTGPPPPPVSLTLTDLQGSTKRFDWIAPNVSDVTSYNLYRLTAPFTTTAQASRVKAGITGLFTTDSPPSDGPFYYAATAVDTANNESDISNVVAASADRTLPTATLALAPSGIVGPGSVGVTLTVSEPLSGSPFVGATPNGGTATAVDLSPAAQPMTWQGTLTVLSSMPSGPVTFAFSARDVAGNRGTVLTSTDTLTLDTQGPQGTVTVIPAHALGPRTSPQPVVDLSLDEPASATPVLRFVPPTGSPIAVALSGAATSWQGALTIDPSMGDGTGHFELDATDPLGNAASGAVPNSEIPIDNTPPAGPSGLLGQSLSAGHVRLTWGVVASSTYNLYRATQSQGPNPGDLPIVTGLAAPTFDDVPIADGSYSFAVTAVDIAGNESQMSTPVTAVSDRTPPGNPTNLQLAIEGNQIRATWTSPGDSPASSCSLYRATEPITSVLGLTPVLSGLTVATALDRPPTDGAFYYAVAFFDAVGNVSGLSGAGPVNFDQGDPFITVTGVSEGLITNQCPTVTYSAADFSLQSVTGVLDGTPFASGGSVCQEGDHVLVVGASDSTGNTSTKTVHFAIDLHPPEIALDGIADGAHYEVPVTPLCSVTDSHPATIAITLNGASFLCGTTIATDGDYTLAIHAVDAAGSTSDRAAHFTVDVPPPAIASLELDLLEAGVPVLSWPALTQQDVVGYVVFRDGARLTPAPIAATSYVDNSFDAFSAHTYAVLAVDAAGHEGSPRHVSLPLVSLSLTRYGTNQQLTRRYFDTVTVSVTNRSETSLPAGVNVEMTLKDSGNLLARRVKLLPGPVAPQAAVEVTDVFPAGSGLSASRILEVVISIPAESGSRATIRSMFTLSARDPALVVDVLSGPIVRGTTTQVRLRLFNRGSAKMQVLTSEAGGPTRDVELLLKDRDGNVLGSGRLDQRGGGVIVTQNLALAEVQAGSSFLFRPIDLQVPLNAPNEVVLEAIIHTTHSNLLSGGDVLGPELAESIGVPTGNPAYLATALVAQAIYQQGETISISGRVYDPSTNTSVANVPVRIGITTRGFDRSLSAVSDSNGNFYARFVPVRGEAGSYSVWATHPSVTARDSQDTFDIVGMLLSPGGYRLRMAQGSSVTVPIDFVNRGELSLTGLAWQTESGSGVQAALTPPSSPWTLDPGRTDRAFLTIVAAADAAPTNFVSVDLTSAEQVHRVFEVELAITPPFPVVAFEPALIELATSGGNAITANLRVRNIGSAPLEGAFLERPSTSWISVGTDGALGTVPPGGYLDIPVTALPPPNSPSGQLADRIVIHSTNAPPLAVQLFVTVTSSRVGSVRFEVRNTENVLMTGASVWIQSIDLPALTYTRNTNSAGLAEFTDLPTGAYAYRVQASGVEPSAGQFTVVPGGLTPITVVASVIYVSFEWSVTPVTIEDRYDFTVSATYETFVPAPVLVPTPASFSIELQNGATFVGEYTVTNHGLVAADAVAFVPFTDSGLQLEMLIDVVPRLQAQSSVTIPFRLTRVGAASETESDLVAASALRPPSRRASLSRATVGPRGDTVSAVSADGDACATLSARVEALGSYTCAYGTTAPCRATETFVVRPDASSSGSCGSASSGCRPSTGFSPECLCVIPGACGEPSTPTACIDSAPPTGGSSTAPSQPPGFGTPLAVTVNSCTRPCNNPSTDCGTSPSACQHWTCDQGACKAVTDTGFVPCPFGFESTSSIVDRVEGWIVSGATGTDACIPLSAEGLARVHNLANAMRQSDSYCRCGCESGFCGQTSSQAFGGLCKDGGGAWQNKDSGDCDRADCVLLHELLHAGFDNMADGEPGGEVCPTLRDASCLQGDAAACTDGCNNGCGGPPSSACSLRHIGQDVITNFNNLFNLCGQ
jgi:hypothetical protein